MDSEQVETSKAKAPARWPWLVVVGLVTGGGIGLWLWHSSAPTKTLAMPAPIAPADGIPTAAEPPPLPPVGVADGQLRALLAGLSPSPLWAKWLQTEDLARRFASAVNAVADGESPRLSLGFLTPTGPFKVVTRSGKSFVEAASFQRYDGIADAFASLDAGLAGKAYGALRPLLEAAYREIGRPKTTLDERLGAAFARLQATPVPEEPLEVVAPKVMWLYADPKLEGLSAASKHLLRMGPRNQKLVGAKLAELSAALGLPKQGSTVR